MRSSPAARSTTWQRSSSTSCCNRGPAKTDADPWALEWEGGTTLAGSSASAKRPPDPPASVSLGLRGGDELQRALGVLLDLDETGRGEQIDEGAPVEHG